MMKTLLLASALLISLQSSFAAETCKEAVALKGAQAAQLTYGSDSIECLADYNTIKSIGPNQYSVSVSCGDLTDRIFNVSVKPTRSDCSATAASEDLRDQ